MRRPHVTGLFRVSWDGRVLADRLEESLVFSGSTQPESRLLHSVRTGVVMVARGAHAESPALEVRESGREAFRKLTDFSVSAGEAGAPVEMMRELYENYEVRKLAFEGEGALFLKFLEESCVDELCLIFCPQVLGNRGGETVTGRAARFLPASVKAALVSMEQTGGQCVTRWMLRPGGRQKTKVSKRVFRNS
jgi:riboflavin biosynthesis pyrimidine reductase